jgi:hypothetical protein
MKKLYIGITIATSVFIYVFIAQKFGMDRERKLSVYFNSSNIHGVIEFVGIGHHKCVFKLKGEAKEYYFDPIISELNGNILFQNVAEKGDSIEKEAYSEILKLKKNGRVYVYKFRKIDD